MVGLDGRLSGEACHQLRAVSFHQLSFRHDAECPEDIGHDTGDGGLTRSWITCKHVMLALEGIGLTTFDLQIQEGCQVGYLLFHTRKTHQTVEFRQTV